jgi:hypothetical protein
MEVLETGYREGEKEGIRSRIFRLFEDGDRYYYLGLHEHEGGVLCLSIKVAGPLYPKIWRNIKLPEETFPIELLSHLVELGIQAQARWNIPRKVYRLHGGAFSDKKSVRDGPQAGTLDRFSEMVFVISQLGRTLR